jgi:cytochrome bd-type quinol oxidase subunit 2
MGFGLVVLFGFVFGTNPAGEATLLGLLRDYFLRGAIVLAAVALLVGIVNLAAVHSNKIREKESPGYSFLLLAALLGTVVIGLFDISRMDISGESNFQWTHWLFTYIQIPVETSLMAVLAISLTYASARLLGQRLTIYSVVFLGVLMILLLGVIPQLIDFLPFLSDIRTWIIEVPAVGGARGVLLGVSLGIIATGLRILMGSDRPYKG